MCECECECVRVYVFPVNVYYEYYKTQKPFFNMKINNIWYEVDSTHIIMIKL